MTELLEQAISQIQQLPPDQQDAIASRFLAECQDQQQCAPIKRVSASLNPQIRYWCGLSEAETQSLTVV
jgi:hypothetical protein